MKAYRATVNIDAPDEMSPGDVVLKLLAALDERDSGIAVGVSDFGESAEFEPENNFDESP